MLSAIIVAGGLSRRMGLDKLFAPLAGKPLIAHTIAAFEAAECVDEIVIVARPENTDRLRRILAEQNFARVRDIISGGEHRHDSVAAGIARVAAATRYVAVHDAARPLITPGEIRRVYEAALRDGAATLAHPITDTIKRVDAAWLVSESISRDGLFAMQTPQIFRRDMLDRGYAEVARRGEIVTDEVSAMQLIGERVTVVPAEKPNPKITFTGDLLIAEALLAGR